MKKKFNIKKLIVLYVLNILLVLLLFMLTYFLAPQYYAWLVNNYIIVGFLILVSPFLGFIATKPWVKRKQ